MIKVALDPADSVKLIEHVIREMRRPRPFTISG